ncbi:MAG: RecQ family ATP-dependent DNA helicase [Cyanobacteria bacterium J06623_7]
MNNSLLSVREKLRQIWGYEDFRPPQGEIVRTLLESRDALVILPTGGGKSICFQLPALLQDGLTVVVSPLVALMENQVRQLQKLGLSGALLHSELPREEKKRVLRAIAKQELRLLYLSPETLLTQPVWQKLTRPEIKITGIILDEAHCLTQWGTTFRPAYRRLGAIRRSLLPHKPQGTKIAIAAFTATANARTQQEIAQTLELQQPRKFLISPYRPNLSLRLKTVWTPRGRRQALLKFVREHKAQSGLVYVRSRNASQTLAAWFNSLGYPVAAYHAGLITKDRRKIEQDWIVGKIQFVICTSAFGMGIDKPDVRFVAHYQAPELLAEYLQEVGRAGRDGNPASALTLVGEPTGLLDSEDLQRRQFFTRQLQQQHRQAQKLIGQLPQEGNIDAFQERFPQQEIALGALHSQGLIHWQDPFNYCRRSPTADLTSLLDNQKHSRERMQRYLKTKHCRWRYLLYAFGFKREAHEFSCGTCDNCQKNSQNSS